MSLISEANELSPQSPADIKFTESMSQQMTVPHRISVHGHGDEIDDPRPKQVEMEDKMLAQQMLVPDRILVTGGGDHASLKGPPREIQFDRETLPSAPVDPPVVLSTPPSTLTLHERPYPTVENEDNNTHTQTQTQMQMPDTGRPHWLDSTPTAQALLHPAEEVALLKRQMTRVSTRLYILEQEMEHRRKKEYYLLMLTAGYFAIKMLRYLLGQS